MSGAKPLGHALQHFAGMKQEAGETADQRAVEADVLKVLSNVDLNHVDQLIHVPRFHLIGDEGRNPALVFDDELARRRDASSIDLGSHFGVGRELGADLPQELGEAMLERGVSPSRSAR